MFFSVLSSWMKTQSLFIQLKTAQQLSIARFFDFSQSKTFRKFVKFVLEALGRLKEMLRLREIANGP